MLNEIMSRCHEVERVWNYDENGNLIERNKGEQLMLIVSEISECMEGERKSLMDTHLPHRPMAEVELADAAIRIFNYATRWGYDLEGAIVEKTEYNATRADHTYAARNALGGKKF